MRVKKGEIYIAANGNKFGHLVLDVEKYKKCDDIVTQPFTSDGIYGENLLEGVTENVDHLTANRIDKFKLTVVRYTRCDEVPLPNWIPTEIIEARAKI